MGLTIIGGAGTPGANFPPAFAAPIIKTQATWGEGWQINPDLILVSCGCNAGSTQISTAQVQRRYGHVKYPFENNFPDKDRKAVDLNGQWVQVNIVGTDGSSLAFQGVVQNQATELMGNANEAIGVQSWIVDGGMKILEKQIISGAYFWTGTGGKPTLVEWVPPLNKRDARGLLVGNASGLPFFGGVNVWDHYQYLGYLVTNFIQQPDGPTWTIGGQASALQKLETSIVFSEAGSALAMLQKLIPVEYGLDFTVTPTADGFEITVFALTATTVSVSGISLPANPNTLQISKSTDPNFFQAHLIESVERKVDKVEVIGKRIVVCGTLRAANANALGPANMKPNLVPKWSAAVEADYIAAGGQAAQVATVGSELCDRVRRQDKYREVYHHFGAPVGWDLDGGNWAVQMDDTGKISQGGVFQSSIRETLPWIPLREGYDYTKNPAVDNTGGIDTDVKHPLAWIIDSIPQVLNSAGAYYGNFFVQCDLEGMHVSHPFLDWGIVVDASPAHLIALNHWTQAQWLTSAIEYDGRYDYQSLVATIAIESDHRIRLAQSVPANMAAGDGSVMTILDSEAELWVMLPGTVVGVTVGVTPGEDPGTLVNQGTTLRILRNDTTRLALILAGAISKYQNARSRGTFVFKGFYPWGSLVGSILTVYQQGDTLKQLGGVVTSVEWIMKESPETIVKVGYT